MLNPKACLHSLYPTKKLIDFSRKNNLHKRENFYPCQSFTSPTVNIYTQALQFFFIKINFKSSIIEVPKDL
jgi:hypothetical protein